MNIVKTAILFVLTAILSTTICIAASSPLRADPLLAVDLNRSAIIADIVRAFEARANESEVANLKSRLEQLRADRLLAASLASSRGSLQDILTEALSTDSSSNSQGHDKALGDLGSELVYTPIVPCPIVNTYTSPIGRLATSSTTAFDASATDFAPQGGQNACATALPANMAAIAVQLAVVSPSNEGWLNLWPVGQTIPNNVTLGYYRDQTGNMPNVVTGSAIVPLCTTSCAGGKEFNLFTASEAIVTISVVGYFSQPHATALDCTTVQNSVQVNRGGNFADIAATCAAGYAITGGGCLFFNLDGSAPTQNTVVQNRGARAFDTVTQTYQNKWTCRMTNNDTGIDFNIAARAQCCRVPGN